MTNLGIALAAYQHEKRMENRAMAKQIGISQSTLSRIKNGAMPDAIGFTKIMKWMAEDAS